MASKRFGPDGGSTFGGPIRTREKYNTQSDQLEDLVLGWNPRQYCDMVMDFTGPRKTYEVSTQCLNASEVPVVDVTDTNTSRGFIRVPKTGQIVEAYALGEDTLAIHADNYVTFTITNQQQDDGAGGIVGLIANGSNTTDSDATPAGTAWTAKVPKTLTLTSTAADTYVHEGDVLECVITTAGTLANTVEVPTIHIVIATVEPEMMPRLTKTDGQAGVIPTADSANGEVTLAHSATSEAQVAGLDWKDQLLVPASAGFLFEARIRLNDTLSANERFVVGMCAAYNATFDSNTDHAWFRCEANNTVVLETDDSTTNNDDQATSGITSFTADTYYHVRIDATDIANVQFFINNTLVGTLSAAAWVATDLLQPCIYLQKDTGTDAFSATVDYMRVIWQRLGE